MNILRLSDESGRNERGISIFVGEDTVLECLSCKYDARTSGNTRVCRGKVSLHTLHHGTIAISVNYFICGYCGQLIPYDGLKDGLFCVNDKHLFSHELLDM